MKLHPDFYRHPANILAFLCVAIIAGAFAFYKVPPNTSPKEYSVELEGKIVEYPDTRPYKTILTIQPTIAPSGGAIGRVRVYAETLHEFSYGEIVQVKGVIKEPENFDERFNWRGYLAKENTDYIMYYPEIVKTGRVDEEFMSRAYSLRAHLQQGINSSLLPPHNSLYSAMLLGNKGGLSDVQRDALASAGLSHIVAISGMHIAVILFIAAGAFIKFGLRRQHASILALMLIVFYILMIGAPASALRAGIMAGVLILGWLLGRPGFSWRALLLAGAVMVLFNPYIVRYDVGFQLSFLAVLGIILFFEKIEVFLKKLQKRAVELISRSPATKDRPLITYVAEGRFSFTSIIAVTLSAQALTFPLIIYNFGNFSLVSPVTNLLVVPLLSFVIGAGFIAAAAPPAVSVVLSAPAWMFSEYIWFVVELFS